MSETLIFDAAAAEHAVRDTLRSHSTLFLVQAALLIVAGLVAITSPLTMSMALTWFLGWILIVGGLVEAISLIAAGRVPHFWLQLFSAAVSLVTGILFVRNVGVAVTTLAILLVVFFLVVGIAKVVVAFAVRPLPNWGWLLVSGLIGIGLAIFLGANPLLSLVALGIFIGIQFLSEGLALGWLAWQARKG
jgi:uncharacterized membrane protein HdeD (DUF308 family)